jgi:hypothetical protein
MTAQGRRDLFAGLCVLAFLATQTFQQLAHWFWIPTPQSTREELATYALPVDQARAMVVLVGLILLIVPYCVVALRYCKPAPLASLLGLVFGTAFIGFETASRSLEFFLVGQQWSAQLLSRNDMNDSVLEHYALWKELSPGWVFPLRLSALVSSCAFAAAIRELGFWRRLGQFAFALNALRLLGRFLATFAAQHWLDSFNNRLYFPAVFVINAMLSVWFFYLARESSANSAGGNGPQPIRPGTTRN